MGSDSAAYPYDTVVRITDTIGNQEYQASGVLISPDEVLTASHVVDIAGVGAASNIVVTPSYDNGTAPYGSANGAYFHYIPIADTDSQISNADSQSDYAVIHLSTPFTGLRVMGLSPNFAGGPVTIAGYPPRRTALCYESANCRPRSQLHAARWRYARKRIKLRSALRRRCHRSSGGRDRFNRKQCRPDQL